MHQRLSTIRDRLASHGQEHVLTFVDELDEQACARLFEQIEMIDFERLATLLERSEEGSQEIDPSGLEPARCHPRVHTDEATFDRYRNAGEQMINAGKIALFAVAGGQGTRLGWSGPKGTYPTTVVTGKPIFRILAEQLVAIRNRYGVEIPFYIMTSPLNDAQTRAFFLDNNCFGLSRCSLFLFPQQLLPSLDAETGKLLLASRGELAMNPDGHGGSIAALARHGALEDMVSRGIEHISYVQVDNPLVRAIDPFFLGLHATAPDSSGEMSSKMIPKTDPQEKVGVFCRRDGKTCVVEYINLPTQLAEATADDGTLRFNAGSMALHAIGVAFLQRLAESGSPALPVHRATKKVACVDPSTGMRVEPESPNVTKLETFVFDALPLAESSIVLETTRVEEFAPIKNATGPDSPETSHRLQTERAARWLEANDVTIPRTADGTVQATIEISPLTAMEPTDLAQVDLPTRIEPGEAIAL